MPFKSLAPELVPLVHHIELAKAGWSLRLTEQLATAAACTSGQIASADDLRLSIEKQYGVRASEADIRRAVGALTSKKILLEVEPGRFKMSEAQRDAQARQKSEADDLEKAAKAAFEQILVLSKNSTEAHPSRNGAARPGSAQPGGPAPAHLRSVSRSGLRSFDAHRRTKSEIDWVTDRFEQPWRGLFYDIERSGGRAAMIVTVEGRRALRVSLRGWPVIVLQQTAEPLTTGDALLAWR